MRLVWVVAVLGLVAVVTSLVTFVMHEEVLLTITLPVDATVGERIGLNADADGVHFGTLGPGMQSSRRISLNNTWLYPVIVSMRFKGGIAKWARVEEQVVLSPGESRQVEVLLAVPQDAQHGVVNGTFVAVFKRK